MNEIVSKAESIVDGYKGGDDMPLAGYLTLLGVFNSALIGLLAASEADERREKIAVGDVLLLGAATFKLARIVAKDRVTSPLRAPFTEYVEPDGTSEVKEKSRGKGLQRAIGDLITCPWCVTPWVAGALAAGFIFKPRAAKTVAKIFAAVAVADFIQHAYSVVKEKDK